jgi:hypothetical protein
MCSCEHLLIIVLGIALSFKADKGLNLNRSFLIVICFEDLREYLTIEFLANALDVKNNFTK